MTAPLRRFNKSVQRTMAGPLGNLLMVAVGTVLVVGSGFGVYLVLQNVPHVQPPVEMRDVVVVSQEVAEKAVISREALRLAQVPVELVPAAAVTNLGEVEGKVTLTKLVPGEMLVKSRLVDRAAAEGLAAQLGPNEVAVTFPALGIASVAALLPGDRVDILATFGSMKSETLGTVPESVKVDQATPPPFTTMVLQDLRVLSVSKPGSTVLGVRNPFNTAVGATAAEGTGQVVFAAMYEDALFLKSLKDAENAKVDLILRPVDRREGAPTRGITLLDGLQQRDITVPGEPR